MERIPGNHHEQELEFASSVLAEKFGTEIERMTAASHTQGHVLTALVTTKLLQMFDPLYESKGREN